MRLIFRVMLAVSLTLVLYGTAAAEEGRTLLAGVASPGNAINMTRVPSLVRNAACSKDCGTTSGSVDCTANQTCDCACNRQPICECR